jgi:hypothetical protein
MERCYEKIYDFGRGCTVVSDIVFDQKPMYSSGRHIVLKRSRVYFVRFDSIIILFCVPSG